MSLYVPVLIFVYKSDMHIVSLSETSLKTTSIYLIKFICMVISKTKMYW